MSDSTRGQHTGAWIGAGATIAAAVIGTLLTVFLTMRSDDGGGGGNDPEIPQPDGTATVFLSRDSGPGGTEVRVSGEGFLPGERVVLQFHTEQIGDTTADDQGGFANVTVVIPTSFSPFAPQQFTIIASGDSSIRSAQAPFTITG